MLRKNKIVWYDSNEIRKAVEQGSNYMCDLWYYWTQAGYEINNGTITTVYFGQLLEELKDNDEHGLAANLEQLMKEIDPEQLGVFVGYFW